MRLVIVSGRSGSGKSTALAVLEDNGFYCIDNLPAGLLPELAERALIHTELAQPLVAVSVVYLVAAVPGALPWLLGASFGALLYLIVAELLPHNWKPAGVPVAPAAADHLLRPG